MSNLIEKQLKRDEIFSGEVLHLVKDTVILPNGKTSTREMCLHIGAVAIIPLLDDGRVVMERQYRYAQEREYLEIPAGKLNTPDEDLLLAAKRELSEETGAVAKEWIYLGEIDTTPALMNEKIHLYLAKDISFAERHLDDDEFLNVELIPLTDLIKMVERGEIMDAKTQIAILKAVLFHY
jgi:ADP-ribose pyrophosphatase